MSNRETYKSAFSKYEYRFGKGKCGFCGKKLEGRRRKWCSDECVEKLWLEGKDWQTYRSKVFARDKYKCVKCGRKEGTTLKPHIWHGIAMGQTLSLACDHIIPVAIAPEKQWDLDNLQTLCENCHLQKTKQDLSDIANFKKGKLYMKGKQALNI